MKHRLTWVVVVSVLFALAAAGMSGAQARGLTCVGLFSETGEGFVSYRVGTGDWVVIKVGDKIPGNAEIRVNVVRDWIEVSPSDNPNAVYEIDGAEKEVVKKVSDILKGKPRLVSFPKAGAAADPKFKDKLVVRQYLGRQIYENAELDQKDIKYGDVLDSKGKVKIIGINNTITLMNASGKVTTVIGPLKFDVVKVLTNQKLYKFLNVPK